MFKPPSQRESLNVNFVIDHQRASLKSTAELSISRIVRRRRSTRSLRVSFTTPSRQGDWIELTSRRGSIVCRALVTEHSPSGTIFLPFFGPLPQNPARNHT
jgi:nitrate reductase alpha subunit